MVIHANTASVAQLSLGVQKAMSLALDQLAHADFYSTSYSILESCYTHSREQVSKLLNVSACNIALINSTSDGLAKILGSIPELHKKHVAFGRNSFLSIEALAYLGNYGQASLVGNTHGIITRETLEEFPQEIDVLVIEWVNYRSGRVNNLTEISDWCSQNNVIFIVDAVQGFGAVKMNFKIEKLDAFIVGAHKWVLGPEGAGFAYVSDRLISTCQPNQLGYRSVEFNKTPLQLCLDSRKFETGTFSLISFVGFSKALEELVLQKYENRTFKIEDNTRFLIQYFRPFQSFSYLGDPEIYSGIISFEVKSLSAHQTVSLLGKCGIIAKERLGCVRLSPAWNVNQSLLKERLDQFMESFSAAVYQNSGSLNKINT